MKKQDESSLKIAEFLLEIKAIKLQPDKPFTWASGWKSPIYCDNRVILSYPKIRTFVREQFVNTIEQHFGKPDIIAGVATGAIAHGALVADSMGLPFIYIRSEAKSHGLTNLIEGKLEEGQSVVVIEDLISTGKSSLKAVEAVRQKGGNVIGMAAIFTYDFEDARLNFKNHHCELKTLCDYPTLLEQALRSNFISENQISLLNDWRLNPSVWGQNLS
jgi:orotate phosphoribosyltransferase